MASSGAGCGEAERPRAEACCPRSADFTGWLVSWARGALGDRVLLASMRCARVCGDIRSGVTGSLCGGVAEPVRIGRAAAGVRRVLRAWRWQACWLGEGCGDVEPAEQRAKRRIAPRGSAVSTAEGGRLTEGGGGGEMRAVAAFASSGRWARWWQQRAVPSGSGTCRHAFASRRSGCALLCVPSRLAWADRFANDVVTCYPTPRCCRLPDLGLC